MKNQFDAAGNVDKIKTVVADASRLKAVRATYMLDIAPSTLFDDLIAEASKKLNAPLTLITLVDEYRDYIVGQLGLPEPMAQAGEIRDNPSFCQLTVTQNETLAITDTQSMPIFQIFPSVRSSGVRAHLGIPLRFNGQPVGNCCVMDFRPRKWNQTEIETLTKLTADVMAEIELLADAHK